MVGMYVYLLWSSKEMEPHFRASAMANSSCTRIGYRVPAGSFFRDIKAIGCRCPLYLPCDHGSASVAHTQSLETSVYRWYGCWASIALRSVALIIACYGSMKAVCCTAVYTHSKAALDIAVSGAATAWNPSTNCL